MEYTYEEVMTALRNADAAGDSEAATRLAEIASSMMSQPEEATPTEQPEETSMLDELGRQIGLTTRGAISGVTAIPGMVSDAATTLVNMGLRNPSLTPTAIREKEYQLPLPSQAQQQLMTRAGLPEPQNQLERAVQSGVGAMTGVGAEASLVKAVGTQALAPLTQQLGTQTATAGIAAPVATMVSEDVAQATESPVLSIAAGIAAGVISGSATAKAIKTGQPLPTPVTIEDVRKQANEAYTQVDNLGVTVKPLSALGVVDKIKKGLDEFNFNPELDNHKPIEILLKQFERQIGQQRVKFATIEQMRQAANQMKTSKDPVTKLLAGSVVNSMDIAMSKLKPTDVITGKENVGEALKTLSTARNKWKVASRAQILEDVLDVAEAKALDPKASESELIRRGLINLASNKRRMALFNSDEQKAIRQTANSGTKDALLSFVARFNPQRNQIVAGGTLGAAFVDPISAALVSGSGFAADKMQQAMRSKQTQKLISDMLAGRVQAPEVNPAGYRSLVEAVKASSQ